mgnify:CR=1 FL=1
MRRLLVPFLVALMASGAATALAQESVKVGVITSLTGRFAEFGEQHQAGIQAALEDVNAAGGVNGVPLEVVYEDDTSEVNAALTAAETLVNQNLPLVMGAYSSSITNPLAQYFTRQQRPFLVFTSGDDAITRAEEEIKLIREYRDRLIADVVTGQIDVRGWRPGPDDVVSDEELAALGDDETDLREEEPGDGGE